MTPQTSKIKLQIADYEICAIPTGFFGLDGGAMFGTVPKVLWEKSNPPDSQNRIQMEARSLLLKGKNKNILIDTGNGSDFIAKYGEKLGTKFAEMYGVDPSGNSLLKSLKSHDLEYSDITDVILTHLHFDHCGGSTTSDRNGKIIPTFPNATYYVQKANYLNAKNPNIREKASYLPANFEPLMEQGKLILIDGPQTNYLPNISLVVSNGHTEGHQVVLIEDEDTQLFYCGDVIPTSSHVRSAWVMGYDLNPLLIIEEKIALLNKALSKPNSYLYFEHDPYCDLAQVERNKNDFQVSHRFVL